MSDPIGKIEINPLHEDVKAYAVEYRLARMKEIDGAELRGFASDLMRATADACIRRGAKVIGHIKAYIEHDSGFLHANTVGESGDITVNGRDGVPLRIFKLVVNTVIYGLTEGLIREATEAAIAATSVTYGLDRELVSQTMTRNPL